MKMCVLRNFAKFKPATLLKKRLWQRCFPVNFAKFLSTFLQNTSGRLLLVVKKANSGGCLCKLRRGASI